MFILLVNFIIACKAQIQINPISGQQFFYGGKQLNQFGQSLNISQPDLGFQVQGGLIQGPLNTKINISSIISVSLLEQYNLLAALEFNNSQYQIQMIQYYYNGTTNDQTILFNISSNNIVCQQIKIIDYLIIIVHCINTTNNSIILYNYNQSQITMTQSSLTINQSQLVSVQIQYYQYGNFYNLYFIYILQFQSTIYNTNLYNNVYSQYQQIWTYNAQFIQVFITELEEIFALQFNYLLYQYQSYFTKYLSQNNSNWLNMIVLDYKGVNIIYLINNYTLNTISFQQQFKLIVQTQLPFVISNGQLFSNIDYTYLITQQFVLTYFYEDYQLNLYQYNQYILPNTTLLNAQQNILININIKGIQLYQVLDYYIYNTKPNQSGNITLNYYDQITQLPIQNKTIYVNTLSEFSNQICQNIYNFDGFDLTPSNNYYFKINANQAQGSNISYYQVSNINGDIIIENVQNFLNISQSGGVNIYALSNYNSLLIAQIISNKIYFVVYQYQLSYQQYQLLSNISASFNGLEQQIQFVEYDNGTIMTLVFQSQDILVYEYIIFQSAVLAYTIDLNNVMSSKMYDISYFLSFYNTIFISSTVYEIQIALEIGSQSYKFIANDSLTLNYISGMKYDQNYVFAIVENKVDIYVFDKGNINYFISWEQPGDTSDNLYFFPLKDGYYVLYGSDKDMSLVYYDMFKIVKLGQIFNMSINTTGYTFNTDAIAYSFKYFYISVEYNSLYYINIYQCTQSAINALYKSVWINNSPVSLSVTSNSLLQVDYLLVNIKESTFDLYEIPHNNEMKVFPQFQTQQSYNFTSQVIVNNNYNQINYTIQVNIEQPYINIFSNQNIANNITNNITNSSIIIDPYQYFNGVIQNYSVSCSQCQKIYMNQIISDQYLEFDEGSQFSQSFIQDNIQYLYISTLKSIIQFTYNYNQSLNLSNYNTTGETLVSYSILGSTTIYYMFLEINTNSISWISQEKSNTYINSILQNTNQTLNISLPNVTQTIISANQYQGIIQIVTSSNYYCYYYAIINQNITLQTILINFEIKPVTDFQISLIITQYSDDNIVFGIIYQIITSTIKILLLDVQLNDESFILNKYKQINLMEFLDLEMFPIQSISQMGYPTYTEGFSIIHLVYTNMIQSGTLELLFDKLDLIDVYENCKLQLFNTSYQQQFTNMIDIYQNQVAILNVQQQKGVYQIMVSLFLIDFETCNQYNNVQPYAYQLLYSNNSLFPQINYLNENQLLISYDDMTILYQVNQQLEIEYVTNINSTITLNAYNTISSSNQTINVFFSPYINNTINNNTNNTDNNNTNTNNTDNNNTNTNNTDNNNTNTNNTDNNNTNTNNTDNNQTNTNNTNNNNNTNTNNNTDNNNTNTNNTDNNNTNTNNTDNNNTNSNTTDNNNTIINNTNNTVPNNTDPNNPNSKSNHLKWYWILLITILTIFIVIILIIGIYMKFYKQENDSYYIKNDHEIEIKTKSSLQTQI